MESSHAHTLCLQKALDFTQPQVLWVLFPMSGTHSLSSSPLPIFSLLTPTHPSQLSLNATSSRKPSLIPLAGWAWWLCARPLAHCIGLYHFMFLEGKGSFSFNFTARIAVPTAEWALSKYLLPSTVPPPKMISSAPVPRKPQISKFQGQIKDKTKYKSKAGGGTVVRNPPANAGGRGSTPGLGRSHMPRSN